MARTKDSKFTHGPTSVLGFKKENDTVDHINIHSMADSELGRKLSHFAHTPFVHPHFGPFYSMEGFWYFARCGFDEQLAHRLRYLSGFRAKQTGKSLPYKWSENFKEDIIAANYQKIIQNENICELMIASELPFDHYYTFGVKGDQDAAKRIITPKDSEWLVPGFEAIRTALKEGVVPTAWIEAEKRYLAKA